jgi:lysophospholipase L1-like esterase
MAIGIGISLIFGNKSQQSWSSYWSPQTCVVENADGTKIILTYSKMLEEAPDKSLFGVISNLVAGYIVSSVSLDATQKILTVELSTAMYADESATVIINSGSNLYSHAVTNNITREAEYTSVYNAMSIKPSSGLSSIYNKFIKDRKASGVWAKMDKFLWFGTPAVTQTLINWKNPGTLDPELSVTPPTFEAYKGFLGVPASSTSINTKFNPTRDGVNFTQNNAGIGVYILNNRDQADNQTTIGGDTDTPLDFRFIQIDSKLVYLNSVQLALNHNTTKIAYVTNNDGYGFYHLNRLTSTSISFFKELTKTNKNQNTTTLVNVEISALARTFNATVDRFGEDQIVAIWFTCGLIDAEVADLRTGVLDLINYRDSRVNIKGKINHYFGDSITLGWDSYDTSQDWVSLLTAETVTTKDNQGVSSMSLMTGHTPNFKAVYDSEIPTYNSADDGLISFAFGVNDITQSLYSDVGEFIADLDIIVKNAISKGWNKNRIMIHGSSYLTDYDAAVFALNTAIHSYCASEGINYYDPRTYLDEHGAGTLLLVDKVHPTDAGYAAYYTGLMREFKKWFIY